VKLEFDATTVSVTDRNGVRMVALADDPANPENYFVLQRSATGSDQDRSLGQDTYHFEASGSLRPGYGGIEKAALSDGSLLLEFGAAHGRSPQTVLAHFRLAPAEWRNLSEALQQIFGGTATRFTGNEE
jgi:Immunity protein 10